MARYIQGGLCLSQRAQTTFTRPGRHCFASLPSILPVPSFATNLPVLFCARSLRSTSSSAMADYIAIKKRRTEIQESGPFAENDFKCRGLFSGLNQQLTIGGPGPDRLRRVAELLSKAAHKRMAEEALGDGDLLQYGNTGGDPLCRLELAKFLSKGYGSPVDVQDLMLSGGATQAMAFLLTFFFNAGDTVFVEDPTYFINLNAFKDYGIKSVAVPLEKDGINTEALEAKFKEFAANDQQEITATRPFRAMFYAITVFHNPTTICYSPEKCRRVVELARKYDILVVCDDVYNVLSWMHSGNNEIGLAPPRLVSYDRKEDSDYKGNVISCGSFSKFTGPGLRLGWFETAPHLLDMMRKCAYMVSGGNFNTFTSGLMGSALEMGLIENHVANLRKTYSASARALWKTLQAELPEGSRVAEPMGGYFIWVELPEGAKAAEILKIAKEDYKVAFLPGNLASPCGNFSNCLRISFSYYGDDDLQTAAKGIAAATRKHLGK
ncbi:uncharacterized protein YER152C-like [Acanthaster planci]|uniref:Uncharacterized protein YER152C-like n=1 Tax=Acanthaster planci TaxID=133434 RepID=A0A8B7ZS82_ACAPL|nr:uncharacterized protein YER152C-like [Acanthaster planci]